MNFLAIRTDKPQAELYLYKDGQELASIVWEAHRQLGSTIQLKIEELIKTAKVTKTDIDALAIYKGPGSFTGLRIGFSVANALADSWQVPIVSRGGADWLSESAKALLNGQNERISLPEYGAPAATTPPRK